MDTRHWTKVLNALLICVLLTSCAALDRVRPQAISPEDKDLSSVQDSLVFFAIHINSSNPSLQLHRLVARNLETKELYVFPFYNNSVLGSFPLTYTTRGNSLTSLVFLDIPAGTYLVTEIDFYNFTYNVAGANLSQSLEHELQQPLLFSVSEGSSYVGQLHIAIAKKEIKDEWPSFHRSMVESANPYSIGLGPQLDEMMNTVNTLDQYGSLSGALALSMQQVNQKIGGNVAMMVEGPEPADIELAKRQYKALTGQQIFSGRFWFAEKSKN